MSSYFGLSGLIPQFAGYGALYPYASTGTTPNRMGGYSTNVQVGAGGNSINPWVQPSLASYSANPSGTNATASPVAAANQAASSSGTMNGGGSGGWLSGLLGKASSDAAYRQLPALPDMGIKNQGMLNAMNYQQYLQNLANLKNDQRFQTAIGALEGAGTTAIADVNKSADAQNAVNAQSMISRGLTNSTIEPTLRAGVESDRTYGQQRVNEGIAQMLINLLQSKTDQGPNANAFAQLMQGYGNYPNQNLMNSLLPQNTINYGGYIGARFV